MMNVSLTSFNHHPYYSKFVLEVQDNWALQSSYNLPINEFMEAMEQIVINGYTFAWGADVSEKGLGIGMLWRFYLRMSLQLKK